MECFIVFHSKGFTAVNQSVIWDSQQFSASVDTVMNENMGKIRLNPYWFSEHAEIIQPHENQPMTSSLLTPGDKIVRL